MKNELLFNRTLPPAFGKVSDRYKTAGILGMAY
jgi:hypothetical protein